MNKEKNVSVNIFDLIDSICRQFRKEWKRGAKPRIGDFLDQVPKNAQANLFYHLLDTEIRYRRRKGESPISSEYLKKYSEFSRQIRQAFDESTMASVEFENGMSSDDSADADLTQSFNELGVNRLGDYELLGELGRGGFGVVYDARHLKRYNRVALKTLPTGIDGQEINAERLHNFRKEFRALSEINHPNLVGMQTLEVDGSQWFFTMDLIEGEDFLGYVRPNGELDESRLRASLAQLASGIVALHELGIVHRDLKPSNVLVQNDGHLLILDFGLVAQLQTPNDLTVSKSGLFAGTPKYAAPEQMFGDRSEASDWYAFGTMLYEALTGGPPFVGQPMDILRLKQAEDPSSIPVDEALPSDLVILANGLLRREPLQRPRTHEILRTLQVDLETRMFGSTRVSSGSEGSASANGESSDSIGNREAEFGEAFVDDVVLVGREKQLSELDAALQDFLSKRKPMIVWVSGKSGEGKSSLVEKFLQPLRLGDEALVLSGRCYDRESVPYKAIDSTIEPLGSFLRAHPSFDIKDYISSNVQLLNQTFPVLRRVKVLAEAPNPDIEGMDNRQLQLRAFDALRDLWTGIGRRTPIVIFIDDLQWGDADSVEMLWEMLRGSTPPSVLLIGSFRSDEAEQSPFLTKWRELEQKRQFSFDTRDVSVQRLDAEQGMQLVERLSGKPREELEPELVQLVEESGGNPYLLELLIDSFQTTGIESSQTGLGQLLERRLNRLPTAAIPLLQAIAVAGQAAEIEELAATAELDEQPLSLLTHMRSEKLIRLIGSRDELRVDTYHDKVRETMLDQMDPIHRHELHLRLAEFIEKQDMPSSGHNGAGTDLQQVHLRLFDLAYHYAEADDPRAFQYQLAAGQRALDTFAAEEALEYFKEARQRLPESADTSTQYQTRLGLSEATLATGQIDQSRELFKATLKYAQTHLDEARCQRGMGLGWLWQGKLINAKDHFYEAVRLLGEPEPQSTFGRLWQILISQIQFMLIPRWMSFRNHQTEDSKSATLLANFAGVFQMALQTDFWAMAAYQVKQGTKGKYSASLDRQLRGYESYAHFFSLNGFGRFANRYLTLLKKKVADAQSDVLVAEVEHVIAQTCYYLGQLDEAEGRLIRSTKDLKGFRAHHEGLGYHYLRHIESIRGRTVRICAWGKQEFDYATKNGDIVTVAFAKYGLADGLARSGLVEPAIRLARQSGDLLRNAQSQAFMIADQELGRALMQAARYDQAREVLESTSSYFSKRFLFTELWLDVLPLCVEATLTADWHLQRDRPNRQSLREAQRMARRSRFHCLKFPTLKPHVLRVNGRTAKASGKIKKAKRYFDKAITSAEKIGAHYEHARALIDKSLLDYPDASSDRQHGIELLESLGCVLPEAEIEHLGIDREEHFARAALVRDADRKEMKIPPFDLVAWEKEDGRLTTSSAECD